MCGRCEGEPYRGVRALFNGDYQALGGFEDRADWTVLSSRVAVYLGASALSNEQNALFRGCDTAQASLDDTELTQLRELGKKLSRPIFGRP